MSNSILIFKENSKISLQYDQRTTFGCTCSNIDLCKDTFFVNKICKNNSEYIKIQLNKPYYVISKKKLSIKYDLVTIKYLLFDISLSKRIVYSFSYYKDLEKEILNDRVIEIKLK